MAQPHPVDVGEPYRCAPPNAGRHIDVEGQPEDLVVGAGGVWVTSHTS